MPAKPLAALRRRSPGPVSSLAGLADCGWGEHVDRERGFERTLERVEREGLDEVRRRLELKYARVGRVDAREQDRHVARAEAPRNLESRLFPGLDHCGIDADVLEITTGEGDRLVSEPTHDELQQSADVVVRFTDENACHRARIGHRRRDWASGMV